MKAKCPHCDEGCTSCDGGLIDVSFPEGPDVKFWETMCKDCGGVNGGQFTWKGRPVAVVSCYAACPECGGDNLELIQRG